jgi:hypothetical protein
VSNDQLDDPDAPKKREKRSMPVLGADVDA